MANPKVNFISTNSELLCGCCDDYPRFNTYKSAMSGSMPCELNLENEGGGEVFHYCEIYIPCFSRTGPGTTERGSWSTWTSQTGTESSISAKGQKKCNLIIEIP